jgi:hypothetical protein
VYIDGRAGMSAARVVETPPTISAVAASKAVTVWRIFAPNNPTATRGKKNQQIQKIGTSLWIRGI